MIAYEDRLPRRGDSAREIAERSGLSVRQVQNWTAEPREEYLSRAQQRHEQIRRLRASGMTMRAIAAEVGCTVGTVHYALNRATPSAPDEGETA